MEGQGSARLGKKAYHCFCVGDNERGERQGPLETGRWNGVEKGRGQWHGCVHMLTEAKGGGGREGKRRRYHQGGIQRLSYAAM